MDIIKNIVAVDANTIAVTKQTAVIPEVPAKELPPVMYEYSFLLKQKVDIQKQWDEQIAQKNKEIDDINLARQAEIDEVSALISGADNLKIVAKPIEILPIDNKIIK